MEMKRAITNGKPSSNIKAVGYDAATKTPAVEFNGGGLYHYANVDPSHYEQMMKLDVSTGGYIHKFVKSAHKVTKQ